MSYNRQKAFLITLVAVITLMWVGEIYIPFTGKINSVALAVVGRPATPVSYAGVARRTPVSPRVNTRYNRGGPVNRVGRR